MSDKLIHAQWLIDYLNCHSKSYLNEIDIGGVMIAIGKAPAVDAVEVVRCSQCLHSTEEIWSTTKRYGERGTVKCCNPNSIAFNRLCLPRDFCRVGERRDDNVVD